MNDSQNQTNPYLQNVQQPILTSPPKPYPPEIRSKDGNSVRRKSIHSLTATSPQRHLRRRRDTISQLPLTPTSSQPLPNPHSGSGYRPSQHYSHSSSPSSSVTAISSMSQYALISPQQNHHQTSTSVSTSLSTITSIGAYFNGPTVSTSISGQMVGCSVSSGTIHDPGSSCSGTILRAGTRKRRVDPLETKRSYTVFQRKLLSVARKERILLLDKQWIHILPSSTKSLNSMFDKRKSVSYHVRLLASAKIKSRHGRRARTVKRRLSCGTVVGSTKPGRNKNAVVILAFKKGKGTRSTKYDMRAESPAIAREIVQALKQLKARFDNGQCR